MIPAFIAGQPALFAFRQVESSPMQLLRWMVIVILLLGLPTLAVLGDVPQVTRLWSSDENPPTVAADIPASGGSESNEDGGNEEPEEPGRYRRLGPGVFPKRKELDLPIGKSLRPAIYRPLATDDRSDIRRVLAKTSGKTSSATRSITELEAELQALGVRRYHMDEAGGTFSFMCEFAPSAAGEEMVVFQTQSTTAEAAMQDALRQARTWQRKNR